MPIARGADAPGGEPLTAPRRAARQRFGLGSAHVGIVVQRQHRAADVLQPLIGRAIFGFGFPSRERFKLLGFDLAAG
jgi:hypothetical protein